LYGIFGPKERIGVDFLKRRLRQLNVDPREIGDDVLFEFAANALLVATWPSLPKYDATVYKKHLKWYAELIRAWVRQEKLAPDDEKLVSFIINKAIRVKALGFAETMLQQTLAPLTMFGETIPATIYEDPYVLGYLAGIAGCGAILATGDKLSVEDRGRVAVEAFHAIAGANGRVAGENTMRFASEQNELYLEGRRQAYQEVSVAYGQLKPSDDPEVERAFSQAEELGNLMTLTPGPPSNANAQASAILGGRFTKYVRANHSLRKS
jgi:hypothetical protein